MQKKISILGCGWLGFPLAITLLEQGYEIFGSTTTETKIPALAEAGIKPVLLDLEKLEITPEIQEFFNSEILVINVPPKRNGIGNYVSKMSKLREALLHSNVKMILFVSSTGVYAIASEPIDENGKLEESNELASAEKLFKTDKNPWQSTILRLAGLFGPERQPGKFLAGHTDLPDPEAPVNLIHLADCIQIISEIIRQEKWNEVFNACSDEHPTRQEFYQAAARKLNLPEPVFTHQDSGNSGKLISNQKVKDQLQYQFKFPDPIKALQEF